jgi:hypothetical protein
MLRSSSEVDQFLCNRPHGCTQKRLVFFLGKEAFEKVFRQSGKGYRVEEGKRLYREGYYNDRHDESICVSWS